MESKTEVKEIEWWLEERWGKMLVDVKLLEKDLLWISLI